MHAANCLLGMALLEVVEHCVNRSPAERDGVLVRGKSCSNCCCGWMKSRKFRTGSMKLFASNWISKTADPEQCEQGRRTARRDRHVLHQGTPTTPSQHSTTALHEPHPAKASGTMGSDLATTTGLQLISEQGLPRAKWACGS
jgi:hypothetical protein